MIATCHMMLYIWITFMYIHDLALVTSFWVFLFRTLQKDVFESGYHEGYFTGCLDTSTILWRPKHFFPTGGSLGDFQAGRRVGGLGTGYEETWYSHLAGPFGILLMPLWDRREPRVPPGSLIAKAPEKLPGPKRKGSSSNHHFSGANCWTSRV